MKIRIKDNSVRLRLDKKDLDTLSNKRAIFSTTQFPGLGGQQVFSYGIKSVQQDEIAAQYANGNITIFIPQSKTDHWINSDQVGIEDTIPLGQETNLKILIEKDFKCLVDRPHENEDHMFDNPKA